MCKCLASAAFHFLSADSLIEGLHTACISVSHSTPGEQEKPTETHHYAQRRVPPSQVCVLGSGSQDLLLQLFARQRALLTLPLLLPGVLDGLLLSLACSCLHEMLALSGLLAALLQNLPLARVRRLLRMPDGVGAPLLFHFSQLLGLLNSRDLVLVRLLEAVREAAQGQRLGRCTRILVHEPAAKS